MYERHADLLPEGPARIRAAATARSAAAMLGPPDLDRYGTAFAPDIEFVDHRTGGFPPGRGAAHMRRHFRVLFELAADVSVGVDDILCLQSDGLLIRWRTSGTERAGGGAYARDFLLIWLFGPDGLVTRIEHFDTDREAEALARFDEVAAGASRSAPRRQRRVRANAACANAARVDAAVAARNVAAFPALLTEDTESVHHPTGVTYDRHAVLSTLRSLVRAEDATLQHEPLATLDESLALCRARMSFGGLRHEGAPFGAVDSENLVLVDVDAQGYRRRTEFFAPDRLGDAIVRLYARYAELCADAAGARAAATARSVAAVLGPFDLDRYAAGIAADVEFVDHRSVGFPSGRGRHELLRSIGTLLETANDAATRVDDVLAARPDALLMRWTTSGTDRVSGGPFEWQFLRLCVFGADGLLTRAEQFDVDRDAEALARFDELTAATPASHFANAAARAAARFERCWREGDWEGVVETFAPTIRLIDRRSLTGLDLEGGEVIAGLRIVYEIARSRWEGELLATRGERLALLRWRVKAEYDASGPAEVGFVGLVEVDATGRWALHINFDLDALDAAYAELDDRYAAGEAASFGRVAAAMQGFRSAFASRDWDALAAQLAPELVVDDHRLLGWETLHGPAAYIQALRSLIDLAPDARFRLDHVTMSDRGYLVISTWVGTREGGAFEAPSLVVAELDGLGRIHRFDQYDMDQLDQARAR